ncbi:hypothetical protein DICPUDRAFT_155801 [Dictyostelium purpureum]|uniref:Elongator complex protein 2 n=1 Tax=Dictyostelium purpureum TaxID=5786 RepID=F0ZUX4_DICPU|nr:uncharacterized protein DICPUDRAFT_155801 [Dictyostelium purpureum]EGC32254.1 hypothetical protein DICPUDRAFT_155801 [Dictyostelium purpureum]|eukprot:XP_003291221.1 hypothetical protein DICPUDRAFT_155801 [Dictyostelium purpureum]
MTVESEVEFISVGANCLGDCLVWGQNGLAAYGAQNFVALFDPIQSKVLATLPGHKDRVNHIVWVPNVTEEYSKRYLAKENEILSCSSDNTIISWREIKGGSKHQYKVEQVLKGHSDSVTSISVLDFPDGSLLLCSTSADNTVKIWKREAISKENLENNTLPQWSCIQTIDFKPKCMECCSIAFIPDTHIPIIALGGLEPRIHIFIQNTDSNISQEQPLQFKKLMSLQGHQDWIRCLSFTTSFNTEENENELILASSSQDFKIRLWKLSKFTQKKQEEREKEDSTNLLGSLSTQLSGVTSLSTKGYLFNCNSNKYIILLDAVLSGHDDWVYSIHWSPATFNKQLDKKEQPMCLLSASMDKTAIVWRPDRSTGIWIDESRVGDMGGNILGLYGAVFSPDSKYILSHGYNGAFHFWKQSETSKTLWEPQIVVSGHFGPVQDLMWSPDYSYMISCSTDRTLRLFSEWKKGGENNNQVNSWNEIARPQIHGYDLECFTFVYKKSHVLVSGAEEKIMRAFVGSQNFVDTLCNISKVQPINDGTQRPLAANQPSLGLSNKPYGGSSSGNDTSATEEDQPMKIAGGGEEGEGMDTGYFEDEIPFNPEVLSQPPFEEHLLQSSLWPEIQKLYGHGNEIISVACSYDGQYLASACRASAPDQATVRIWNISNWKEVANLKGHTLTIVNLAFSHDSKYLLGVSRDRMWTLWKRTDNPEEPFIKVISAPKAHGRIIWSGSWSHDDKYFATGARDKVVKIWSLENITTKSALAATLPTFGSGVTCVEFAPKSNKFENEHLIAVGEDEGKITIWKSNNNCSEWSCIHTISSEVSHTLDVRKIRWRDTPIIGQDNSITYQIATCSLDNSVRIFNLKFN